MDIQLSMQSVFITTNVSSNPTHGGVLDTTLYDKGCQWVETGQRFSPCTSVSSTNKTDDTTEILLKLTLYTITLNPVTEMWSIYRVWYSIFHFNTCWLHLLKMI